MKYLFVLVVASILAACNQVSGPDGKYVTSDQKVSLTFRSSGTVHAVSVGNGLDREAQYTHTGNTIKIQFEGGPTQSYVLNADGTLTGEYGTIFKKQ